MREAGPAPAVVAAPSERSTARHIEVTGTVQGVGFRPFVWRLATDLGLTGTVRNHGGRVEIDAFGPATALEALTARLTSDAPPRAKVESVLVRSRPAQRPPSEFLVIESAADTDCDRLFPPDLATCDACVSELFDPTDRRFRYPFINCTDCGPRATIIDGLPYDRERTTMADFPMCPACCAEYTDPGDRRFHAEPVACRDCGPQLRFGSRYGDDALAAAIELVDAGGIAAIKGIGGYHLACDATDERAVRRLRERKQRWAKPFAVMVGDLASAGALVLLSTMEIAELTSPVRPIVVARPRPDLSIAPSVRGDVAKLGVFLPYTPVHHLLLTALGRPIVLTSGNRRDEPIAVDDREAAQRLGGIADGILANNRRIRSRYEDSVVTSSAGGPAVIRRGRGLAPDPLDLPVPAPEPVLAVGAQLKHTFAIARGSRAHLAGHLGDLADLAAFDAFERNLRHLRELLDVRPSWVAHDLHPGYLSTRFGLDGWPAGRRIPVQHHHAHIASCAAEHGYAGPVVGVALDGLGMGDDGTFWGGEILLADLSGYRRLGRFGRAPMPGGEAAIRQPWRMALGYLFGAEPIGSATSWYEPEAANAFLSRLDPQAVRVIRRQVERGVNAPIASSAGRLFDAASSLLALRDTAAYEGEAAIMLEEAAEDPGDTGQLPYRLSPVDGVMVFDPRPTLAALLAGMTDGQPVGRLASRFQRTIAAAVVDLVDDAVRRTRVDVVCLSGGVFQNDFLAETVPGMLTGVTVLRNRRVPCNDGGISYGQAAVAAARLRGAATCA